MKCLSKGKDPETNVISIDFLHKFIYRNVFIDIVVI